MGVALQTVQPRPGALRLIKYLQDNHTPIAVASNSSREIIDITMGAMQWLEVFTTRCTGDDETRGKPAPDVYLTAARILGVDPTKCLGLEDSPRGAQALVLGGKARALMEGRPNLATEDIWALAPMALRHRLVLGYDALADGVSADDVIEAVLAAHPDPVESPGRPASATAH